MMVHAKQILWLRIIFQIKTTSLLLLFSPFLLAACGPKLHIQQKPISFDETRIKLTKQYQLEHYGIDSSSIYIEPRIIVLHWTCLPSLELAMRVFNPPIFPAHSPRRQEIPGELNVSSHYLVDRDGSIYQLMPDNWMARHVIGLNHYAIGIENVGGIDGKDDLTEAQVKANASLVVHLQHKYPTITSVIGHHQYLQFKNTEFWLEKDPNYEKSKTDPGDNFVLKVKKVVSQLVKAYPCPS